MLKEVRSINDIPENIYSEIPYLIFNSWKQHFVKVSKYANDIVDKKIVIPRNGGTKCIKSGTKFFIEKSIKDPLDAIYIIFFRITYTNFAKTINEYFESNGLAFDFDTFYDKDRLLLDASKELYKILNYTKNIIKIDLPYVTFSFEINSKPQTKVIVDEEYVDKAYPLKK